MNSSQKWFIGISLLFIVPVLLGFIGGLLGISSLYRIPIYGIIALFVGAHGCVFFLQYRMKLKSWTLFIPAIALLLVTLFMGYIAIKNAQVECNIDEGCMNEDFSMVFVIIFGFSMIISALYSLLFQKLWYKKPLKG